MVNNLVPSSGAAGPASFGQLGTRVLFLASDTSHGLELWVTDGTAAATSMVTDINPGSADSFTTTSLGFLDGFTPAGGNLVFLADDGSHGTEVWTTDGTTAHTSLLTDIRAGSNSSNPRYFTSFGNRLLFQASDGTTSGLHGTELWITDGTTAGTSMVKDIAAGNFYASSPRRFVDLGNGLATFSAYDNATHGREIWVTDGTAPGTSMLANIASANNRSSNPGNEYVLGTTHRAVFAASPGTSGSQLWVTDGTTGGTSAVRTFSGGFNSGTTSFVMNSASGVMQTIGNKVIFDATDNGVTALWVTDGTSAGTYQISANNVIVSNTLGIAPFTAFGNNFLFWNGTGIGSTPWITDGTIAGTSQIASTVTRGYAYGFGVVGTRAVFSGLPNSGFDGRELWVTNGAGSTYELANINTLTSGSSSPKFFTTVGDKLFFSATDSTHNTELWATTGFYGGTSLVKDINTTVTFSGSASAPNALFAAVLPCFAGGTYLRGLHREIAVQDLREGDLLRTANGNSRTVRWIGHRTIDLTRHAKPEDVAPVRIAPHAFGEGLPQTALRLSPDHAVYADGVLIPVRYLVNGATIAREFPLSVTWFHVELADNAGEPVHDVILAEGLPTESYLDTGNRGAFANGGDAIALHPDFARAIWARQGCARLVVEGPEVLALRSSLLLRADLLCHPRSHDPKLAFLLDGNPIATKQADGWTFIDLPAGSRSLALHSLSARPDEIDEAGRDTRRLGVALSGLRLNDNAASLHDPRLRAGWHDAELAVRWTDGAAEIDVRGLDRLAMALSPAPAYWPAAA